MNQFVEVPVNKISLAKRSLVCGFGINDANYNIEVIINNKKIRCPYYKRWRNMLERCYSAKHHAKYPTYKNCTVCDEWLLEAANEQTDIRIRDGLIAHANKL